MNPWESTEDIFQWVMIAVLLLISFTTLGISISSTRLSKEVHRQGGKVDMIEKTYISIFQGMHERLLSAMELEPEKSERNNDM